MFLVWNEGGLKAPYVPGVIRGRRVPKISQSVPVQRAATHNQDLSRHDHESQHRSMAQAYQQSEEESSVERQPAILAKQIMTSPVVTLPMRATLSHAWDLIRKQRFRHLPVVDHNGNLVGMLSDRDLFYATIDYLTGSQEAMMQAQHVSIHSIMMTQVLSASPKTEIRDIARVFFQERIGAMPLVNEGEELVGILTRSDILRAVVNKAPFELWV